MAFIAPNKDLEPQESISQGFIAPSKDLETTESSSQGFVSPSKDLEPQSVLLPLQKIWTQKNLPLVK